MPGQRRGTTQPGARRASYWAAAVALLASVAGAVTAEPTYGQSPADPGTTEFHASPSLPLDHWAYPILRRWIAEGRVTNLSPLTTPYRRLDVARALQEMDPYELQGGDASWHRELTEELRRELDRLTGVDGSSEELQSRMDLGGSVVSQAHRDPMRAHVTGSPSRTRPLERLTWEATGRMESAVAGLRVRRDGFHRHDAQFPDGVVERSPDGVLSALELRMDEAYVEVQGRRARLSFGRQSRNWAPPGTLGLLRSPYPYTFDELGYRLGSDRLFLMGTVSSLRDFPGDTARYHAVHRLEFRPRPDLVVAISEASMHGGAGEPIDFRLISPLAIWEVNRKGERDVQSNLLAQADLWWRAHQSLVVYAAMLADSPLGQGACCETGGTLGLEFPTLGPRAVHIRTEVTALQSLLYRTARPWEEYSVHGIGLGWDQSDVVHALVEAGVFAGSTLLLRPYLALQLRGEESEFVGRRRPSQSELPDVSGILVGRHESTLRVALAGRWRSPGPWSVDLSWDLGVNRIRHMGHVEGRHGVYPVGRAQIGLTLPLLSFTESVDASGSPEPSQREGTP